MGGLSYALPAVASLPHRVEQVADEPVGSCMLRLALTWRGRRIGSGGHGISEPEVSVGLVEWLLHTV